MPRRSFPPVLSCALLFSAALAGAEDFPFTLRQAIDGGRIYFYDARWDAAFIEERTFRSGSLFRGDEKTETREFGDIVVLVSTPTAQDEGAIQAVPDVKTWIDPKGNLHSLEGLKRQMRFDHWLLAKRPDCAESSCVLSARRDKPVTVKTVLVTGIVDAQSLKIDLWQLEARYDAMAVLLEDYCRSLAITDCGETDEAFPLVLRWSDGLARSRRLLEAYELQLSSVAVRPARNPHWVRSHSQGLPDGDYGGGLEGLVVPGYFSNYDFFKTGRTYFVKPTGDEPEARVDAAVDLKSLAALRKVIEDSRRAAAAALRDVEFLADAATEVPEERGR
ncbi:MAG: hypothetical protein HY077_17140 [Elusimicrobia bacterium]|nr:hypothetical protein [Elusimicrobiota bacterium]